MIRIWITLPEGKQATRQQVQIGGTKVQVQVLRYFYLLTIHSYPFLHITSLRITSLRITWNE